MYLIVHLAVAVCYVDTTFGALSLTFVEFNELRRCLFVVVVRDLLLMIVEGRNLVADFDKAFSCTRHVAGLPVSGKELGFTGFVDLVQVILSITYRLFSFQYPDIITIP